MTSVHHRAVPVTQLGLRQVFALIRNQLSVLACCMTCNTTILDRTCRVMWSFKRFALKPSKQCNPGPAFPSHMLAMLARASHMYLVICVPLQIPF